MRTSRSKLLAQDKHRGFHLVDVICQDLERCKCMKNCKRALEVVTRSPVHGLAETMAKNRYTYEGAPTKYANITTLR